MNLGLVSKCSQSALSFFVLLFRPPLSDALHMTVVCSRSDGVLFCCRRQTFEVGLLVKMRSTIISGPRGTSGAAPQIWLKGENNSTGKALPKYSNACTRQRLFYLWSDRFLFGCRKTRKVDLLVNVKHRNLWAIVIGWSFVLLFVKPLRLSCC